MFSKKKTKQRESSRVIKAISSAQNKQGQESDQKTKVSLSAR